MKLVNRYVYPTSTRESIKGLRHYTVDGEEVKLPSVTTVLSKTKDKKDQESINRWIAKVGEARAEEIKNEADAQIADLKAMLRKMSNHVTGDEESLEKQKLRGEVPGHH